MICAPVGSRAYTELKIEVQVISLRPFCHLHHKSFFGHISGKQESTVKHISDCKTAVECKTRNIKTLWSGGEFIFQVSICRL